MYLSFVLSVLFSTLLNKQNYICVRYLNSNLSQKAFLIQLFSLFLIIFFQIFFLYLLYNI